jgi:integrase
VADAGRAETHSAPGAEHGYAAGCPPEQFNRWVWRPAITKAGLTASRITGTHQLRHRHASLLVASGMNVRRVAEYMGHQDGGALLLRTYSHLMPADPDRVRRAVEAALMAETRSAGVADATS